MRRYKVFGLLIVFLLSFNVSFAQVKEKKYYFIDYHVTKDIPLGHKKIKILGGSGIDPHNSGTINYKLLEYKINTLFPRKEAEGILCIDLENSIYQNLRNNKKETVKASKSVDEFLGMLSFIKNKRPNIKVGIYALPFPFYYSNQKKRNEPGKLDEILKKVDIIFPSLYIYYPSAQKGLENNINFLRENLETACDYAKKYNKEVIPLVWYFVHPSNKKYKHTMMEKSEMKSYIDFIWDYSESDFKLKGILIWNSPTPFKNRNIQTNALRSKINCSTPAEAIDYYKSIF